MNWASASSLRQRGTVSQPALFITLTVKAKYEHTYEYMNNWTSGYCYSPARTLPSLQSLLFGACSSAEHGLSDRMSEVGQRGVGAQVLLSGSFTKKEWPVSANAPSVCLRSFLLCPCALFPRWLPCRHKDLPFAQMADSRGPPPTLSMSVKCCPPECVWDAALAHMPKWKEWVERREMGICTAQDNKGKQTYKTIWPSHGLPFVALSFLFDLITTLIRFFSINLWLVQSWHGDTGIRGMTRGKTHVYHLAG